MRLLLDTHVVLWWRQASRRLKPEVVVAVGRADVAYVSAASAWEVAIKVGLGRLRIPSPFAQAVADSGFTALPINFAHAEAAGALPPHHSDPFDRMLVAQAQVEGLTIVTHDPRLEPYGGQILWA